MFFAGHGDDQAEFAFKMCDQGPLIHVRTNQGCLFGRTRNPAYTPWKTNMSLKIKGWNMYFLLKYVRRCTY